LSYAKACKEVAVTNSAT